MTGFAIYSLLAFMAAYLIGSVSFAVVVSKAMKLSDPRSYGSGNPGATNVLRSGNKKAAVLTLLGDTLKGYVAVMLVTFLALQFSTRCSVVPEWYVSVDTKYIY